MFSSKPYPRAQLVQLLAVSWQVKQLESQFRHWLSDKYFPDKQEVHKIESMHERQGKMQFWHYPEKSKNWNKLQTQDDPFRKATPLQDKHKFESEPEQVKHLDEHYKHVPLKPMKKP